MKTKVPKKSQLKPKKEKSQPKRLKTFSSSQFSLWEDKSRALHASSSQLAPYKNDTIGTRRAQNNSALSQYNNSKGNTAKITIKKKKKGTSNIKSKPKIKRLQQQFEKIKYKESNSQSQIVFSNDETKRQSCIGLRDVKHVQSVNNYVYNPRQILRITLKNQHIRRTEAATKIQKVYRGYMTRKILLRYIYDQQQKLKNRIVLNNSGSQFGDFRHNETNRTFGDRQGQNLMNRLFQNRAIADIHFNHNIRARVEDFQSSVSSVSQNQSNNFDRVQIEKLDLEKIENKNKMKEEEDENNQSNESQEQEDQDSNDENNLVYRRQNPIYSQQEISQYLESSEQQQYQQELDGYQPEIIFETNQQYIQSRKSSLQNKNQTINKLSNKGLSDLALIAEGQEKIRKQLRVNSIPSSEIVDKNQKQKKEVPEAGPEAEGKQQVRIGAEQLLEEVKNVEQIKLENNPYLQNGETGNQIANKKIESDKKITLSINSKDKQNSQKKSPRKQIRYYLDQVNLPSAEDEESSPKDKSFLAEQEQIMKLREQECEKWEQVIKMVSQQIKKSNEKNGEIVNFMRNIMEFSQKNKQFLGSTRSFNSQSESFTTPTSMGYYRKLGLNDGFKSAQLPELQNVETTQHKNEHEESENYKFFKKKKPLKIDIIDSNFNKQLRQSLEVENEKGQISGNKRISEQTEKVKMEKKKEDFEGLDINQISIKKDTIDLNKTKKHFQDNIGNSKTMKKFLASNIQIQDEAIHDILKLRQELLQKRESEELMKLNSQLSKNQLSQQQFLQRLSGLTKKFVQEKQSIDKAKEDIVKGYQAANNLMKQYFFDVRRMGIKLAVSKSQDNLKYKISQPSGILNDLKIDELTPQSTPKSTRRPSVKEIFADHEIQVEAEASAQVDKNKEKSASIFYGSIQSSQESSLDFTQQELKRFRKAANYDLQFNDMNKNMTTISDEFIKQQKNFRDQAQNVTVFNQSPQCNRFVRSITPQRETYLLEDSKVPSARIPPHIEEIIQSEINMLIWEFTSQLLLRPELSDKLIERPGLIRPIAIKTQQKLQFLRILTQNLPEKTTLTKKLNQNITPLPGEILKCMRLDFSEEGEEQVEDENYEQINRYQFVISQEACAKSIMHFKNNIDQEDQRIEIEQIKMFNSVNQKLAESLISPSLVERVQKYVNQRQKFIKNKKQHTKQLRWEVLNIELHCIFDSWNQEIIQICSQRPGFSGIGLNELTLSMINHNKPIASSKTQQIVTQARNKVSQILTDDSDINAKIIRQNFHQMCENDSTWIFYADEALSYALQLVYLVEQDIYSEIAREIRKIMVKSSLVI